MDQQALTEGLDAGLAGGSVVAGAIARFALFPLVTARRKAGGFFVPKPLQKGLVLAVVAVGGAGVAIATGDPPIFGANSAIVGAAFSMALFDAQRKR